MKHAECHAVQQDHQHGCSLEPRGDLRLRRMATWDKRSSKQTNQKVNSNCFRIQALDWHWPLSWKSKTCCEHWKKSKQVKSWINDESNNASKIVKQFNKLTLIAWSQPNRSGMFYWSVHNEANSLNIMQHELLQISCSVHTVDKLQVNIWQQKKHIWIWMKIHVNAYIHQK